MSFDWGKAMLDVALVGFGGLLCGVPLAVVLEAAGLTRTLGQSESRDIFAHRHPDAYAAGTCPHCGEATQESHAGRPDDALRVVRCPDCNRALYFFMRH
jgi:hypothetical protein